MKGLFCEDESTLRPVLGSARNKQQRCLPKSNEVGITPVHYRRAKIAIVVVCVCSLIYNASRFAEYSYMSFHFDQEVSELFST